MAATILSQPMTLGAPITTLGAPMTTLQQPQITTMTMAPTITSAPLQTFTGAPAYETIVQQAPMVETIVQQAPIMTTAAPRNLLAMGNVVSERVITIEELAAMDRYRGEEAVMVEAPRAIMTQAAQVELTETSNRETQTQSETTMDKLKSMVDSGLGYVNKENNNLLEFSGCVALSFITHSVGIGSWEYGMSYAVLYALYGSQLSHKFRGNPAFTFADWLKDGDLTCCDVFKQVMFQIFGYAAGFWLGGLIGLTDHTASSTGSDFSAMLFDEVISVGLMVYLWLHVHDSDRNGAWKDFMGFAVAAVVWMGYKLKLDGAHLNAAVFAGEDFGRTIGVWRENGWGIMDWSQFFAPLLACFFTTLVYTFYHK